MWISSLSLWVAPQPESAQIIACVMCQCDWLWHAGELICAVLFGTASMVGLTLWVGDVITSMIWLQDLNRADREREMRMRDFLRDHDVSWNLRNRVWALCSDGKGSHVVREEEVLPCMNLSHCTRISAPQQKYGERETLEHSGLKVELFKKLPENMMQELRAE
eukprot:3846847-Amphidinium_carterae.1